MKLIDEFCRDANRCKATWQMTPGGAKSGPILGALSRGCSLVLVGFGLPVVETVHDLRRWPVLSSQLQSSPATRFPCKRDGPRKADLNVTRPVLCPLLADNPRFACKNRLFAQEKAGIMGSKWSSHAQECTAPGGDGRKCVSRPTDVVASPREVTKTSCDDERVARMETLNRGHIE
jgi:hypothetical protein